MGGYTDRKCIIGLPDESAEEVIGIDVTLGVFFDGTANNKYNSGSNKNNDDSYTGSWTNVAKLWDDYDVEIEEIIDKIYLEGIGTKTPVPTKKTRT